MATAHDVITRALRTIGALAGGEMPTSDDAADALRTLNDMLAGWEMEGIRMLLPDLALTDTIQVPRPQIEGIVLGLAMALAQEYGRTVNPVLAMRARRTYRALQTAYFDMPESRGDFGYQQYQDFGGRNER
jgi:hypothetical protein